MPENKEAGFASLHEELKRVVLDPLERSDDESVGDLGADLSEQWLARLDARLENAQSQREAELASLQSRLREIEAMEQRLKARYDQVIKSLARERDSVRETMGRAAQVRRAVRGREGGAA